MEKWTAADEKLWAELEQRRSMIRAEWRANLYDATLPVILTDGRREFLDTMIQNATAIAAALEPYVLHPEVAPNE